MGRAGRPDSRARVPVPLARDRVDRAPRLSGGWQRSAAVNGFESNDLRVILVGRTGLDAALRLDPQIELVRVQTPLEAVGELTWPVDASAASRAVVVVAAEGAWVVRRLGRTDEPVEIG